VVKKQSFWYRLGSGFVIGLGLVIPGVSGGVLAMVVGLYESIIAAIAKPFVNWRDNIRLLLPLGIGAAICLLFLARILEYLFAQHTLPTLYFFFGLVIASLPSMVRLANRKGFRLSFLVSLCIGVVLLLLVTSLPRHAGGEATATFGLLRSAMQGATLGVGLVIPGLSASFLLIAFGFYEELLGAAVHLDLQILIPAALGFVPTIVLASRVMDWLFKWKHSHVSYAIIGLMLGSLWVAFPGWPRTSLELVLCAGLFALGIGIASLFLRERAV